MNEFCRKPSIQPDNIGHTSVFFANASISDMISNVWYRNKSVLNMWIVTSNRHRWFQLTSGHQSMSCASARSHRRFGSWCGALERVVDFEVAPVAPCIMVVWSHVGGAGGMLMFTHTCKQCWCYVGSIWKSGDQECFHKSLAKRSTHRDGTTVSACSGDTTRPLWMALTTPCRAVCGSRKKEPPCPECIHPNPSGNRLFFFRLPRRNHSFTLAKLQNFNQSHAPPTRNQCPQTRTLIHNPRKYMICANETKSCQLDSATLSRAPSQPIALDPQARYEQVPTGTCSWDVPLWQGVACWLMWWWG